MKLTKTKLKELTYQINGAAIEVHKTLGPGLFESVYLQCLKYELESRNISFVSEMKIPFHYKENEFMADFRCDLLVENLIVVELKSVEKLIPLHESQLLTYMKLLNAPKGILLNFNCSHLFSEGQKTFVGKTYQWLED